MRLSRDAALPVWTTFLVCADWYSNVYRKADLYFLTATASLLMIVFSVCLVVVSFCMLFTKQKMMGLKLLISVLFSIVILFAGVYFESVVMKHGMAWRVKHQKKFAECSQNAKPLIGSHKFSVCEESDIGINPGSTSLFHIVYDPDMLAIKGTEDQKLWSAAKTKFDIENYHAESLGNGFYLLQACGNATDISCKKLR